MNEELVKAARTVTSYETQWRQAKEHRQLMENRFEEAAAREQEKYDKLMSALSALRNLR